MPMDLLLVRHGEVEAHWRGRLYGCLDVRLSDTGRDEARRAAQFLKPEPLNAIISSGLARTRYGASWIAQARPFEETHDARLREIDRGDWVGLTFAELNAQVPGGMDAWRADAWNMRPSGGENMTDVAERVCEVLDELATKHDGQRVCVVAHSHVIRAALSRALDRDLVMELDLPTGSVVSVDWAVGAPAILHWIQTFAGPEPTPASEILATLATR